MMAGGTILRLAVVAALAAVCFGHTLLVSQPACGAVLKPGQTYPISFGESHEKYVSFLLAKTPPPVDATLSAAFAAVSSPAGLSALGTLVSANNDATKFAASFQVPAGTADGSYSLLAVWHDMLTTNASWSTAGGKWGHTRSSDEFLVMAADPSPQLSIAVAPERVNMSLAVPTPFSVQATGASSWVSFKGMVLASNIQPGQTSVLLQPGTPYDLPATLRTAKPAGPFVLFSRAADGTVSYAVSACWNSRFPAAALPANAASLAPVRSSYSDVAVSGPAQCAAGSACPVAWSLAFAPSATAAVRVSVYANADAAPFATLSPAAGDSSASFTVPPAAAAGSTLYAIVSVDGTVGAGPTVFVSSAVAPASSATTSTSPARLDRLDEAWTMAAAGSALGAAGVAGCCLLFVLFYPLLLLAKGAGKGGLQLAPVAPA